MRQRLKRQRDEAEHLIKDQLSGCVPDFADFWESLLTPMPRAFWVQTIRVDTPSLLSSLALSESDYRHLSWASDRFRLRPGLSLGDSLEWRLGLVHQQEEVSQIPVHLLAPQPGERVLDLCAAPGGKSLQAAVAMGGHGIVVANEFQPKRLQTLATHQDRLALVGMALTHYDARQFPIPAVAFDRVIVDVPCSAHGTIRKNLGKALDLLKPPADPSFLPELQRRILQRAIRCCRKGGTIMYSTCTFAFAENESVIAPFVEQGLLEVLPIELPGFRARSGFTSWAGTRVPKQLHKCLRIYPQDNDTGGFFIAKLKVL